MCDSFMFCEFVGYLKLNIIHMFFTGGRWCFLGNEFRPYFVLIIELI